MIHIDFETRSEANIWKTGAYTYCVDPSTEVLCCAYKINNDKTKIWRPGNPKPQALFTAVKNDLVMAHNAFFDRCEWDLIMTPWHGWPSVSPRQWRCSAAMAASYALPRALDKAGLALGCGVIKDYDGKRVMLQLTSPRRPTKTDPDNWYSSQKYPDKYHRLYDYCIADVNAEIAVSEKLNPLSEQEQKIWHLDQEINMRGVHIDRRAVVTALSFISLCEKELNEELHRLSKGYLDGVSRRARFLQWLQDQGVPIHNLQKATVTDILKLDLPDHVRRALEIRQQLARTSTAKYETMLCAMGPDDRIRDTLLYHGASTGRWSGKIIQLHNLPRGDIKDTDGCVETIKMGDYGFFKSLYPDVMGALSSAIRGMITVEEGKELFVADYSAIEARIVMWLANEETGLRKYSEGVDLYVDMAQSIYRHHDISKNERQLGKVAILGCGYGMGFKKFHVTCAGYGLDISEEVAQKAVDTYRGVYSRIVDFWNAIERTAIEATCSGRVVRCGRCEWSVYDNFLLLKLPNGRNLAYHNPEIQDVITPWGSTKKGLTFNGVTSQTNTWERQNTFGGKLTENIVQAIARDILAEAVLRLDAQGYHIIFTVHDEIVCEEVKGTKILDHYLKTITKIPEWAKGCPIEAAGWVGERYRK